MSEETPLKKLRDQVENRWEERKRGSQEATEAIMTLIQALLGTCPQVQGPLDPWIPTSRIPMLQAPHPRKVSLSSLLICK